MSASKIVDNNKNEIMTKKELLKIFSISRGTCYKWTKRGILSPVKVGGKTFYKRNDINELIESGYKKS